MAVSSTCPLQTAHMPSAQTIRHSANLPGLFGHGLLHTLLCVFCCASAWTSGLLVCTAKNPAWKITLELTLKHIQATCLSLPLPSASEPGLFLNKSCSLRHTSLDILCSSGLAAEERDALQVVVDPRDIYLSFRRSPGATAPSRTEHHQEEVETSHLYTDSYLAS